MPYATSALGNNASSYTRAQMLLEGAAFIGDMSSTLPYIVACNNRGQAPTVVLLQIMQPRGNGGSGHSIAATGNTMHSPMCAQLHQSPTIFLAGSGMCASLAYIE